MKLNDLPILWELREKSSAKLCSEKGQAAESYYVEINS